MVFKLFAILQMYEFSSKSQPDAGIVITPVSCLRYCKCTSFQANHNSVAKAIVTETAVCDTANVRVFKQITTCHNYFVFIMCCLRYCKCTSFQANHNDILVTHHNKIAVCDTANVRVFKQITTSVESAKKWVRLFAILQMYEFSSKSQPQSPYAYRHLRCLRYCKCTSFQANHNCCFDGMAWL